MNKSIYTTALEYWHTRIFKGVNYNEIKIHIEKEHQNKFDYHSERAFIKWFIEAFSSTQISGDSKQLMFAINRVLSSDYGNSKHSVQESDRIQFEAFLNNFKFIITGESDRKLLEFWELKEARTNARQAFRMALLAIFVSLVALIFSPLLEHLFNVFLKPLLRQE